MGTEIMQVRDVPAEDVKVLGARAASRNMSLSSYLRELIHDDTSRPAMADVPALVDAEVASAIRGLLLTSKPAIGISIERAGEMLDDFTDLPLVRYPMQPLQRRVLTLRDNLTAYEGFYVALAESLSMPLLTDDRKYAKAAGHPPSSRPGSSTPRALSPDHQPDT